MFLLLWVRLSAPLLYKQKFSLRICRNELWFRLAYCRSMARSSSPIPQGSNFSTLVLTLLTSRTSGIMHPHTSTLSLYSVTNSLSFFSTSVSLAWITNSDIALGQSWPLSLAISAAMSWPRSSAAFRPSYSGRMLPGTASISVKQGWPMVRWTFYLISLSSFYPCQWSGDCNYAGRAS